MASVGELTIEMAANVARLKTDMDKAWRTVDGTMAKIRKSAAMAAKALAAIGIGLSAAALMGFIKGAIDAADEMKKLSQKTGVAVKDLAGMQLAYRQAGLESGALQKSMSKMSQSMADSASRGAEAFTAMGLSVKNADGSLKSTRDMLGEVADKFASFRDGAGKTALAMDIFGKSGADLIPLLNAGSAALAEYDRIAQQLGLTMDDKTASAAERFNDTVDLLGQGLQGIARQTAAQLLPTLEKLAGNMLKTMTSGDKLTKAAKALAAGMKLLYSAGLVVAEVFNTLGTRIGATFAAVAQAMDGDFKGAWATWKQAGEDIDAGWRETIGSLGDVWADTGDASVAAMSSIISGSKNAAPAVEDLTGKVKELKGEMAMDQAVGLFYRELEAQVEAQEKAAIEINNFGLDQHYRRLEAEADAEDKHLADAAAATKKQQEDYAAEWAKTADQVGQSLTDALMEGGKSASEYIKGLFRAMILKPILQPIVGGAAASILGVLGFPGAAQAGSMGQSMGISDIISGAQTAYSAVTGGAAAGWTSLGQTIAYNFSGPLESFGVAVQGAAATLGALTTGAAGYLAQWKAGQMLSGNYSALGSDPNNAMVAATVALPFIGPLIGGAINRLFGSEPWKVRDFGLQGDISAAGSDLQQFTYMRSKGGTFSSTKRKRTLSGLDADTEMLLDSSLQAIGAATREYAAAVGLSADAVDGYSQAISLSLKGLDAEGQQKAITDMLDTFAEGMLTKLYPELTSFAKIGETAQETLSRLANSIKGVNAVLDLLGLKMYDTSLLGASMADQLANVFGGMESFNAATSAYYQAFYTETERTNQTIDQLVEAFGTLGVSVPTTRDAFRDLVEGLDLTTEHGQVTFAALMGLSPAFDQVMKSIEATAEAERQAAEERAAEVKRAAEELAEATEVYYQLFHTEGERTKDTIDQLIAAFGSLGVTVPTTRDAFRSLVEGLDRTTQHGQDTFAALMGLAPAFDQVMVYLDAVAEAERQAAAEKAEEERRASEELAEQERLAAEEFARAVQLAAEAVAALAQAQRNLNVEITSRGLRATGNGDLAMLYDMAVSHEERLAEERAKGVDVTLLAILQQREFNNALDEMMKNAVAAFQQFAGDVAVRALNANGQGEAGGLLQMLIGQEKELAAARAAGYDVTSLVAVQQKEYANAVSAQVASAQAALDQASANDEALRVQQQEAVARAEADYQSLIDAQFSAAQEAADAARQAWRDVGEDIKRTIEGMLTGSMSPLSLSQRLATSRGLFGRDVSSALGGNIEAARRVSGSATEYAELARMTSGSAAEYNIITGRIVASLSRVQGFAIGGGPAISVESLAATLMQQNAKQIADAKLAIEIAQGNLDRVSETVLLAEENLALAMEADAVAKRAYDDLINTGDQSLLDMAAMIEQARAQYALYQLGIDQSHTDAETLIRAMTGIGQGFALPGFAEGTNYVPYDMPAMIHQGEAIVPKRYNPAAGGGDAAEEIRGLREDNRAQARAMVALQAKLTKLMDRWDSDGMPETRVVA